MKSIHEIFPEIQLGAIEAYHALAGIPFKFHMIIGSCEYRLGFSEIKFKINRDFEDHGKAYECHYVAREGNDWNTLHVNIREEWVERILDDSIL